MIDLVLTGLALAGQWCLGAAIACCVLGRRLIVRAGPTTGPLTGRAELIGLGIVLGISSNSYLQFLWSFAGGRLGRGCSLALETAGFCLGLVAMVVCRFRSTPTSRAALSEETSGCRTFIRCCAVSIVGLWIFAMVQSLLTPQKFWDERAYYGLKAIVLFEDHSIHSTDLAEPDFVQGHPRYPLLIPLAEQHLYALIGRVDDRLSKVLFPTLYLGMVLTLAGVLMRHVTASQAWLAALLLATTPVLMPEDYGFLCGQADAPIACLEGLALFYLWDSLASLPVSSAGKSTWMTSLILGTLAASFSAFTKDEGISHSFIHSVAYVMALAALLVWDRNAGRSQSTTAPDPVPRSGIMTGIAGIVILVAVPALILGPWFAHRRHLPLTGEMNYFGRLSPESLWNGLPTLGWSIPHLASRMFTEARTWGLQWWLLAVSLVLFPRRAIRSPQLFLLLTIAGDIAALVLAGMIAPVTLEEHIGGSSHRFLMQLAPAAVLFSVGQFYLPPRQTRSD